MQLWFRMRSLQEQLLSLHPKFLFSVQVYSLILLLLIFMLLTTPWITQSSIISGRNRSSKFSKIYWYTITAKSASQAAGIVEDPCNISGRYLQPYLSRSTKIEKANKEISRINFIHEKQRWTENLYWVMHSWTKTWDRKKILIHTLKWSKTSPQCTSYYTLHL